MLCSSFCFLADCGFLVDAGADSKTVGVLGLSGEGEGSDLISGTLTGSEFLLVSPHSLPMVLKQILIALTESIEKLITQTRDRTY